MRAPSIIILSAVFLLLCGSAAAQGTTATYARPRVDTYLRRGDRMMQQYRFGEAATNYLKAMDVVRDTSRIPEIAERQMFVQNAISMMGYCSSPAVVMKQTFPLEEFYLYYPLPDHSWRPCPNPLDPAPKHPFADALYLPDGRESYYYSAAGETGARHIYFTELQSKGWSVPSLAGKALVSAGNEIFPVLSGDGQTLYFASNGLPGIGGYDLYSATWNPDKQEWNAPVNMGYPYSSPADDFLLVHSEDGRYTLFASNRECSKDSVVIYVLEYESFPTRKTIYSEEELRKLMALEPAVKKEVKEPAPAEQNENVLRYKQEAALAESLKKTIEDNEKVLRTLRTRYAKADFETRAGLSKEIMDREARVPALTDSLNASYRVMRDLEEGLLAEGVDLSQVLRPVPKKDSRFAFVKRSYGEGLSFTFEEAADAGSPAGGNEH